MCCQQKRRSRLGKGECPPMLDGMFFLGGEQGGRARLQWWCGVWGEGGKEETAASISLPMPLAPSRPRFRTRACHCRCHCQVPGAFSSAPATYVVAAAVNDIYAAALAVVALSASAAAAVAAAASASPRGTGRRVSGPSSSPDSERAGTRAGRHA
eukprot:365412-Chlamydomonas_euryale.AAC.3